MKILVKYFGNHSNRLMQLAHIEAACREHNQKFVNLCFSDMKKYYNNPNVPLLYNYNLSVFILKAILKIQKIIGFSWLKVYQYNRVDIDYEKEQPFECLTKHAIIYGFYFRCPDLIEKHKHYFQYAYCLKKKYYENNDIWKWLCNIESNNKVVAIHIRRGDYKDFGAGCYYYGDDVYLNCVSQMSELLGNKVKFILFSDENISNVFSSYDIVISHEEWYVDQFIMSKCDYIIGPPSSFSGWASYMGDVPLYHIRNTKKQLSLNDFTIFKLQTIL